MNFHNTNFFCSPKKLGSKLDRQNSITTQGFTNSFDNFLQSGALLRHNGHWILIEGPFKPTTSENNLDISIIWSDFYEPEKAQALCGSRTHRFSDDELARFLSTSQHIFNSESAQSLSKAPWEEPSKEDFAVALKAIHEKIQRNEIQKAVPAVFARSAQSVSKSELAQMIFSLCRAPQSLYVYGFWQDGEGILGATPEILFDFENGILKTMALAGTLPKTSESEADPHSLLLNDPKELDEHRFVVEDLQSRLSQWGLVKTSGPKVLDLPMLCHLKTDFEVKVHSAPDFYKLILDLHPTPALGVSPRSAGYKWLAEFPGQAGRRGFGGPFAFIEKEKALCLVAIRNIQWSKEEVIIGSGCGVVSASQLDKEWNELSQKRKSVKNILGLKL